MNEFEWIAGITVRQRSDDWHACITAEPAYWDQGYTAAEAVGELLRSHPERFKILPEATA